VLNTFRFSFQSSLVPKLRELISCNHPPLVRTIKAMLITRTHPHKPVKCLFGSRLVRPTSLAALATIGLLLAALAPARAFTAEQVDKGREMFRLQCARCHGPAGQGISNIYRGMTAPPLIGPSAFPLDPRPYQKMRHFQFRTVRDIYEFASAVMPADQPASLSADDYWEVMAYLLNANGEQVNGQMLNEAAAGDMSLAKLQQRATQSAGTEEPLAAPAGNTPVIEGQGGGTR
jgi:mono/diheme cytochrome c family protein